MLYICNVIIQYSLKTRNGGINSEQNLLCQVSLKMLEFNTLTTIQSLKRFIRIVV
jgi:hypothetical protein